MKEFKTYDEQIELLKKRGLIINDEIFAKQKLKEENYYNLINGYKEIFLDKEREEEFYLPGTTFEDIYLLYTFDRDLKNILLKPIIMIENIMRSLVAYVFSSHHGSDNYLKYSNFETLVDKSSQNISAQKLERRAELIHKLISKLQNDIACSISKKAYISHYVSRYGYIPLWVLVNIMSLGRLSLFYSIMKQDERAEVAINWKIPESDLVQYIKFLSFYRNSCAHDERIFDYSTTPLSIPDTKYHDLLNIERDEDNKYVYGKNDFMALLIILKILVSPEEFNKVINKINGRIMSLKKRAVNIDIDCLMQKMGLVKDWRKILINA